MRTRSLLPLVAATLGLPLVLAGAIVAGSSELNGPITVAGSSTVKPIVEKATKAYMKTRPGVAFAVGGGGSSNGVKSAGNGEVMLGMASRDMKKSESETFPGLRPVTVGRDGIAMIVSSDNDVTELTRDQIRDVYLGRIRNWSELGGADAPIVPYCQWTSHGTYEVFAEYFGLAGEQGGDEKDTTVAFRPADDEKAPLAPPCAAFDGNTKTLAEMAKEKNAIAFASIGLAHKMASKGKVIRLVVLDGVEPTVENVVSGAYGLQRPLNLLVNGEGHPEVNAFVDWMLSADGQELVEALDFIPTQR